MLIILIVLVFNEFVFNITPIRFPCYFSRNLRSVFFNTLF